MVPLSDKMKGGRGPGQDDYDYKGQEEHSEKGDEMVQTEETDIHKVRPTARGGW